MYTLCSQFECLPLDNGEGTDLASWGDWRNKFNIKPSHEFGKLTWIPKPMIVRRRTQRLLLQRCLRFCSKTPLNKKKHDNWFETYACWKVTHIKVGFVGTNFGDVFLFVVDHFQDNFLNILEEVLLGFIHKDAILDIVCSIDQHPTTTRNI